MKILPAVGLLLIGFFLCQLSFGQDTAVHDQPAADSVIPYKPVRDTSGIHDSLSDSTVTAVADSLKAVAARSDSLFSDSVKRYWKGWNKYQVKPGYSYALYSKKVLKGKSKKELEYNIADFYLYVNGQLVQPPKTGNTFFAAGCLCFKYDDTLLLNSGLGSKVGVGVGIKIAGGRFTGTLHANTNNREVYKIKEDDSVYIRSVVAEPVSQSLKLYSGPAYSANEIIIGEYRAAYKKFYQKNEKGEDELRRYAVRIIFRCRVSGGIDSIKSLSRMNSK
jgi:hypothetical protein